MDHNQVENPVHENFSVEENDDVMREMRNYSQNARNLVWVVSATGLVRRVQVRIEDSGGSNWYFGRFSILALHSVHGNNFHIVVQDTDFDRRISGTVQGELRAGTPMVIHIRTCPRAVIPTTLDLFR